ncbi:Uu.00g057620.m01.CDS01 [Anthostomella pinea]|uniref:Uu.00g057620.m01.CDS01 n=1 Tax=Anthostomella pinea TaxID=933095 RepID=A0AAI8VRQ8_9PEZI|nr:Uu.00g057620.m01.CDS01 [Anthostomella pinea]
MEATAPTTTTTTTGTDALAYTAAEKAWLGQHYNIYKDEDREEGRRIVRALVTEAIEE